MKNTTELRRKLSEIFEKLEAREINTEEARSFTSITNAMVKSAIAEGEYNKYLQKTDPIEFFITQEDDA